MRFLVWIATSTLFVATSLASSVALAKPTPEAFPAADLPDVTRVQDKLGGRSGVVDRANGGMLVVASPSAIVVDGKAIVAIDKGAVDAVNKEGGAAGNKIRALATAVPGTGLVQIGVDRSLTYKLLFEIIYSTKSGRSDYQILVRAGGSVMAVPIELPTKGSLDGAIAGAKDKKHDEPLGMVVSVTKTQLHVWSISGKEGSLQKPTLSIGLDDKASDVDRANAVMKVRTLLGAIVKKRWKGKRPEATQSILLQADGTTSMQLVAELMVAMRPQFENISLSAGFD